MMEHWNNGFWGIDGMGIGKIKLTNHNPTSCFFMILGGKTYEFPIVAHVISIG